MSPRANPFVVDPKDLLVLGVNNHGSAAHPDRRPVTPAPHVSEGLGPGALARERRRGTGGPRSGSSTGFNEARALWPGRDPVWRVRWMQLQMRASIRPGRFGPGEDMYYTAP